MDRDDDDGFNQYDLDELQQRVQPHELHGLTDGEKLERLVKLYFGMAGRMDATRRRIANDELRYEDAARRVANRLDHVIACQTLIMQHLGLVVPALKDSEPPHGGVNGNGSKS